MGAHTRAEALGIALDDLEAIYALPDASEARFVSHVAVGDLLYLSGTTELDDGGEPRASGAVGADVDLEAARAAARTACAASLRVLAYALGSLDRVVRIVQLTGYVDSAPGFSDQPRVINAATDLLVEVFGDAGLCARAAIGCRGLALGASVEIVLVVQHDGRQVRAGLPTYGASGR